MTNIFPDKVAGEQLQKRESYTEERVHSFLYKERAIVCYTPSQYAVFLNQLMHLNFFL